jgi:DNA-binding NtrC family response regulator
MKTKFDKKIFVVDDDPFLTAYLQQTLNNIGYHYVSSYGCGKDCLDHIHHNPEIIFLDYQMDDMDGLEVLKEVKDYFPGINVIFTTALEDLSIAVQSISDGSFDFLLKKNITEEEVNSILSRITEDQTNINIFI